MIESGSVSTHLGEIPTLDTGNGLRTAVFFHGGFGGPDPIRTIDKHLGPDGWRVIAVSLPGHGKRSPKIPDGYTYEDLLGTMSEVVRQLPNVSVLIGHSFGGRIAYDLSRTEESVKAGVLLAPILARVDKNIMGTAMGVFGDFKEVKDKAKSINTDLVFNFLRPKDIKKIWQMIKDLPEAQAIGNKVPMLIMFDENDSALNSKANIEVAQNIANSKVIVYRGGHYWFLNEGRHWSNILSFINAA
jgi:pimeloyl-ACP methyl ester carboxylesterase